MQELPKAVEWTGSSVRLLDQTKLPLVEAWIDCADVAGVVDAIKRLCVRGAPAIGIAAAYGMVTGLTATKDSVALMDELRMRATALISARPTAVNLSFAVNRMLARASVVTGAAPAHVIQMLVAEAKAIHEEDIRACHAIARNGLGVVTRFPRLLTHCNAGGLAVSEYGTALAPIYLAHSRGVHLHVYVDETRPLMQGARLTAFELQRAGVPMTLITDGMAATVMGAGWVDAVIVGADRVAANGDVANKIGTLGLAILCQHYGIPFYVACPVSTLDVATPTGADILIEERDGDEVRAPFGLVLAPPETPVFNPAFDVTPAGLISAIITDRGVVEHPDVSGLQTLLG